MSVPTVVFLDTSILDEQNYNFSSAAMLAFLEAVKGRKLMLLLPDPTEREIDRHIKERSDAVVNILADAKRKAPFLAKWKEWPLKKDNQYLVAYQLRTLAQEEWSHFQSNFNVAKLSYEGVDLAEIMNWYQQGRAPFSEKKRKEFPDAFALAALVSFARTKGRPVAVISRDSDFEKACSHYTELLHYPSLPAITEALLQGDKRIQQLKELFESDATILESAVGEEFTSLGFYPETEPRGDVEDVEVEQVNFTDLKVISIGGLECSVAFEVEVSYSAHVRYKDPFEYHVTRSGTVSDYAAISGVAKLRMSEDWTRFTAVDAIDLGQSDIAVSKEPDEREYEDPYESEHYHDED
jgi:hypothetical protein